MTNLRIPRDDWLQIKTLAAASGMSVNQYIINLIQSISVKRELALDEKAVLEAKRGKKYSIWNLPKLAKAKHKPMGLSDLDKIIYAE